MSKTALAKTEPRGAISPVQEIGREIVLIPEIDAEHRFSMRKLGNLHLGIKARSQKGTEYPKAVDYFVLPDVLREDVDFRERLESLNEDPDKPHKLPIMLLSDSLDVNLVTSCDLYGMNGKLKCRTYRGGECMRLNDKTFKYETCPCDFSTCNDYLKGDCAWYHRFRFILPDARSFGYWQIATKSRNNRGGLLREILDLRKMLQGHIASRDLLLVLTNEREFHIPMTDKQGKTTLSTTRPYLLHLELATSLRKLMQIKVDATSYETSDVEESYDMEQEPIIDCDDFESGEQEQTEAEINYGADYSDIVREDQPTNDLETLRALCIDKQADFESETQFNNFVTKHFKQKRDITNLDWGELTGLYSALCERQS